MKETWCDHPSPVFRTSKPREVFPQRRKLFSQGCRWVEVGSYWRLGFFGTTDWQVLYWRDCPNLSGNLLQWFVHLDVHHLRVRNSLQNQRLQLDDMVVRGKNNQGKNWPLLSFTVVPPSLEPQAPPRASTPANTSVETAKLCWFWVCLKMWHTVYQYLLPSGKLT